MPAANNQPRPPSVLHVIDFPGAGWDALAAAACCARSVDADQRLLLIGDSAATRDAAAFGLVAEHRVCPPLNRLAAAVAPLDRAIADARTTRPVDVIHTWSDSARVICREILGFELPITQDDPAPFAARACATPRTAARAALGIAESECAVLLATDRPGVGDARRFAGLIGVLHLADHPSVGVASTRSDAYRRCARMLRGFKRDWDVVPLRLPPHSAVSAADVILYDQGDTLSAQAGPGHATGGILYAAAAAGIPAVTVQSPLTRRLLGPLRVELAARDGSLPEISRVIVPLCTNPQLRAAAGARLRDHLSPLAASDVAAHWSAALQTEAAA